MSLNKVGAKQLVSCLSYSQMIKNGIIPDFKPLFQNIPSKRYPAWFYKLEYEQKILSFEHFMEELIHESISSTNNNLDENLLVTIWNNNFNIPPPKGLVSGKKYFSLIYDKFHQAFNKFDNIKHKFLLESETFSSHQSLFTTNWMLNIETVTNFNKIIDASILEMLANVALSRSLGHKTSNVGILFPIQHIIVWCQVDNWDSSTFENILKKEVKPCIRDSSITQEGLELEKVGEHMSPQSVYPEDKPVQIYVTKSKSGPILQQKEIEDIKSRCKGSTLYVHSSLNINLCSNWSLTNLKKQLEVSKEIGACGVVVHVGKYKDSEINLSKSLMIQNVRKCLSSASERCPLLIETPAGQGTELYQTIEELEEFYNSFDEDEKKLLGVCIDTCHVFAAGYEPHTYLKRWLNNFPKSLKLVHFNDSKNPRNSHIDRHAYPGTGYIGKDRMLKVHDICVSNSVNMVIE